MLMIITTDENWRVDPRVQARLLFHTRNCSSRGAVRGADGRRAHTWGGEAEDSLPSPFPNFYVTGL